MKKEKVLVCIIAQARTGKFSWKSFKNNVLNHLDADLALCVSDDKEIEKNNPYYDNAKYVWKCENYKEFSPAFDWAQNEILNGSLNLPDWKELLIIKDYWLGGIEGSITKTSPGKRGSAAILIFFRWFLLKCIKEKNLIEKYDRFIITRSDFIWNIPHPKMKYLDSKYIWLPNGEFYGGVTDRHAVLSKSNLESYLNIIELIVTKPKYLISKMLNHNKWNMEKYILLNLKLNNKKKLIKFFPYISFTVRDDQTDTTLSYGNYSKKLNLNIKYIREYIHSVIALKFINKNHWKNIFLLNLKIRAIKFFFKFDTTRNFLLKIISTSDITLDKELINRYYKKKKKYFKNV